MATRAEMLAQMLAGQNVTTGAANPSLRTPQNSPTPQNVDRRQMLAQILEQQVATPKTQPGQVAPVDASMLSALANIGTGAWAAKNRKKQDDVSRELLLKELQMQQGDDPFASELQPILPPSARGIGPMEGPGQEQAEEAAQAGVLPFLDAMDATRKAEKPARLNHDLAALLDPRASGLAATRLSPSAWGDPYVDETTGALVQKNATTGEVTEISRPPSQSGQNSRFGSPQVTQSGRLIALDRASGQSVYTDSQEQWESSTDPISADLQAVTAPDGSVRIVNMRVDPNRQTDRTEDIVTSDQAITGAADRSAAETAASESAKTAEIPVRTRVEAMAEDFSQAPKRLTAARDLVTQVGSLDPVFDRVLENAGTWTVGFGAMVKPPGSPAANMEADLNTLGANAAFDRLQQMRESSPTGGALGAISEREIDLLTSTVAAIGQSQSPEQFKANVERLRQHYQRISELAKEAQAIDGLKTRISSLQNRPDSPEIQERIGGLLNRLYSEEDKLWDRLDKYDDGSFEITASDDLPGLSPDLKRKYGLD